MAVLADADTGEAMWRLDFGAGTVGTEDASTLATVMSTHINTHS
jgi:hypothetical protein